MRSKRRKSGIDEEYIRLIVRDELLQIMNRTLMHAVSGRKRLHNEVLVCGTDELGSSPMVNPNIGV